ncbi:MAG: transcription-repair coupling factor [Gemmatimonadetes bacterium]|nr:MAG: transcription-repair coupling factor [Gemmatimonadota bacterium]
MSGRPHRILEALRASPSYVRVRSALPGRGAHRRVGGCSGSAGSALLAALALDLPGRVFVALADDPQRAAELEADLETLLGEGRSALFPQRESLPYEASEPHLEIGGLRVEALDALYAGRARVLVTTVRAVQERAPVPARLSDLRLTLRVGEALAFADLVARLEARGFERVPMVEEVGQFAVRGGLIDVFSFGSPDPVRVEFWGDEIASLRTFDVLDQRTRERRDEVHLLPVDFVPGDDAQSAGRPDDAHAADDPSRFRSLLELLPDDALLVHVGEADPDHVLERTWRHVVRFHDDLVDSGAHPLPPDALFLPPGEAARALHGFARLTVLQGPGGDLTLACAPPPAVNRDTRRLEALLREASAAGRRTLLLCDNEGQAERLDEILGGAERLPPGVTVAVGSLAGGFALEDADPPLLVLTDHEIFRRGRRIRRSRRFRGAVALESLSQLTPGDFVVHMDHGIGTFRGLETVTVAGRSLESMAIEYAGGEILRVPVHRLDLVERWVSDSDDAGPPALHRIGGKRWKTLRRKTEAAIERMTAELLQLYAQRQLAQGFRFSPDTRWQKEMESAFLYDDTPDQRRVTEEVKRDMESPRVMDRLVCGDVGYGKTEVAVRAAFKAVQDGKQVAVLAPTTILVEQHRHTFEERLADFPVRIGTLSRLRSASEQKAAIEALAAGEIDIVIGTHRLLSEDVRFHDLGLLVVDEEQRFGVRHKERLKQMRATVDVLTLTATPIPRTLYLSLSGLRDLSVIRTPPRDRLPVLTHVVPWSDRILSEALERELDRGGQAFFLHNRVETIHAAAERVAQLAPEARIDIAHGQMRARELDDVMRRFVDGEVDVLVCSSIIENGLDVPNANTLIVNRADRFGLSQLYQIRGRVGRSDRRAYCYLVVPDGINEEAARRLKVLEHYTELGSGYQVALRDLEMRGAGNLLGGEQSGFAQAVGLDTYMRLLEQTVRRLRETKEGGESFPEPEVSLPGSALLPESYVSDSAQKLHLYRRLSHISTTAELAELREELADRFGPVPPEVERLLQGAALRIVGRELGVERLLVRERSARVTFRAGVVPRLSVLEGPLTEAQVEVEVRRMAPLSLELKQVGARPLIDTLIAALGLLAGDARQAA